MLGTVKVIHDGLIDATNNLTGTSVARYNFDSGEPPDDVLEQIQNQHRALSRALGVEDPPDLQEFDLRQETDWVSWTFIMAQDLTRLKNAAGVV
jgi:hypothetical protein